MKPEEESRQMLKGLMFTFFVNGATCQPVGSLIPFLRDSYGFSYDFSGLLLSGQSVGNMLAVLLMGILPIYLGRRKTVLLLTIWMAVAYLIFASGIGIAGLIVTAYLMTGIAKGGCSSFSNIMISTLPEKDSSKGYIIHGIYAIGAVLSPIILVAMAHRWVENGWRIMAVLLASIAIVQFVVYVLMPIPESKVKERGQRSIDFAFLKQLRFWLSLAMLFFYLSAEISIVGWQVTYYQDMGLLSDNVSQIMNSLFWLLMFVGRMLGGIVGRKISRETILLTDGIGLCAFFLLMFLTSSPALIMIGIVGVGFFMATIFTSAFSFGTESIKGNDLGCSLLIFGGSLGAIITPALVGLVADKWGIYSGMGLVAATTVLLLITIIVSVSLNKKLVTNMEASV